MKKLVFAALFFAFILGIAIFSLTNDDSDTAIFSLTNDEASDDGESDAEDRQAASSCGDPVESNADRTLEHTPTSKIQVSKK